MMAFKRTSIAPAESCFGAIPSVLIKELDLSIFVLFLPTLLTKNLKAGDPVQSIDIIRE